MTDDAPSFTANGGLRLSISELAASKGLSKQVVAERVARFEAAGRLATRPGKGRAKLVNLAAYGRAAGHLTDLGRAQGAATRRYADVSVTDGAPAAASGDPVYISASRRAAWPSPPT